MEIDTKTSTLKLTISIGNTDNLIDLQIAFLKSQFDILSKVFYKFDFRKNENFYNFPKSDFYPQNSLIMRILDIFVFRGDHIVSKNIYDSALPTSTSAFLSSNEEVILHNSSKIAPNKKIKFDPNLPTLDEKTKFGNFSFDFFNIEYYPMTSISNCLHELDINRCMICEAGFVFKDFETECVPCIPGTVYIPFLKLCIANSFQPDEYYLETNMYFDNTF